MKPDVGARSLGIGRSLVTASSLGSGAQRRNTQCGVGGCAGGRLRRVSGRNWGRALHPLGIGRSTARPSRSLCACHSDGAERIFGCIVRSMWHGCTMNCATRGLAGTALSEMRRGVIRHWVGYLKQGFDKSMGYGFCCQVMRQSRRRFTTPFGVYL